MNKKRKKLLFVVAVAVAIMMGYFFRLHLLGDKSIWWDEGLSVWASRKSFPEIARWTGSDVHPPLYFWSLKVWRWLFGDGTWALRFFSAWVGTLFIAVLGYFGRKIGGWSTGILAAFFLAVHVFAVWWSQEIRMYELAALFLCISTLFFLEWLEGGKSGKLVLYVLFTWLALHTLYLSIFVVLAQDATVLIWLISGGNLRRLLHWTIGQAITGILSLPWAAYAYTHMSTWSVGNHLSLWKFTELYLTLIATGVSTHVENLIWATGLWTALSSAIISFLFASAHREKKNLLVALVLASWFVVPPVGVYGVSALKHIFYTPKPEARYLLISLPAFLLLLSWGISALENRVLQIMAVAFVIGSHLFFLHGYYSDRWLKDDFISISAALQEDREADELVVLHTDKSWPIFAAHYPGKFIGIPSGQRISKEWVKWFMGRMWNSNGGIWLVQTPDSLRMDPDHLVERWLDRNGHKVVSFQVGERRLTLYRRTPRHDSRDAGWAARIFLKRVQVGDITGIMLCNRARTEERFKLYIGKALWGKGVYSGIVKCELFPISFPDLPGRHTAVVEFAGRRVPLGDVRFSERDLERTEHSEEGLVHTDYRWEGGLALLGYKIETAHVRAGDNVKITMLWRSGPPTDSPKKLFVHLLGSTYNITQNNFLWGQKDSEPLGGKMPSTSWKDGFVWKETWLIPVDPKAPPGTYKLEMGWYDPVTGKRLKLVSPRKDFGKNSVILTNLTVESR